MKPPGKICNPAKPTSRQFFAGKIRRISRGLAKNPAKIQTQFKNIVSDLQNFAARGFPVVDRPDRSRHAGDKSGRREREINEAMSEIVFPSIDTLFDKFEQHASRIESGLE